MERIRFAVIAMLCSIMAASCSDDDVADAKDDASSTKISVILDTDLGNCNDDILAMQALFYLQQQGRCNVIGVMSSVQLDKARILTDGFLHFYKADDIPLGVLPGEEELFDMIPYYQLADSVNADGTPLFPSTGIPLSQRLPAWKLYRKLLAEAADTSVVIMCIGKYTSLGHLLNSAPDEYSPLSGSELVSRKVLRLEAMGGCFTPVPLLNPSKDGKQDFLTVEYNIGSDIPLAKNVLENWPVELCLLSLEEGMKYPSVHDEMLADYAWQPDHPIYQVYSRYDEWAIGDVGQYWWDAELVMHAVLGEECFDCVRSGTLSIADDGVTTFTQHAGGNAHIISSKTEHIQYIKDWLRGLSGFRP